jgi:TetR/AcrR family transcriptional regulator of autoinduction and epiphytic fitness
MKKTRSELKHEAILEGAQKAFTLFGVNNTSMDKIAEFANVSKRTVYNHFENKELLVTHIIKQIWCSKIVNYELPYQASVSLKEQLMTLVLNELNFTQDDKFFELIRVAISHTLINPGMFGKEIDDFFAQDTALIRWLRAANDDGRFTAMDPVKANQQILSLVKGQAFWPQVVNCEALLTESQCYALAEDTVELILARYQA